MKSKKPSKIDSRIWELDALRGFMILCVIAVHTLFDLEGIVNINYPAFYIFIRENGGILFILLSKHRARCTMHWSHFTVE